MSFSGKRFRRVRCENVETVLRAANASEDMIKYLKHNAPIFSFTRLDELHFRLNLENEDRVLVHEFKLGEEHEMERRDGSKVKMTYTLEDDNVLNQTIKQPDGKVSHFRREFGDKETKMIVTMSGTSLQAAIYYEVVE